MQRLEDPVKLIPDYPLRTTLMVHPHETIRGKTYNHTLLPYQRYTSIIAATVRVFQHTRGGCELGGLLGSRNRITLAPKFPSDTIHNEISGTSENTSKRKSGYRWNHGKDTNPNAERATIN